MQTFARILPRIERLDPCSQPDVNSSETPLHAVCPKCQQRHTVKATETWQSEIHFCVDCHQSFTVKKPQVTNSQLTEK